MFLLPGECSETYVRDVDVKLKFVGMSMKSVKILVTTR